MHSNDPGKLDLEKQDFGTQHIPQDLDGPIEHPGVSTEKDGEPYDAETPVHVSDDDSIEAVPREGDLRPALNTKSKASSVRSRTLTIVPRAKRRGLLASLALIAEVERPYDYKQSTKWTITFLVSMAAVAGPMGSAIFYPTLTQMTLDLHTTSTVTNLTVAFYMLSMAIFPLWWSSFSETLGRRTIYLVSFTFFVVFNILCAISTSIGMLTAMRVLSGGAAASVQAVGAGTISDVWESRERGQAMGIFYLGPLMGPLLGPIIGGVLAEKWNWRSTMWFLAIYGAVLVVTLTLFLPETLPNKSVPTVEAISADSKIRPQLTRISTRQSVKIKTRSVAKLFKLWFIDPLSVLLYLRFPAVLSTVYMASITFGSLYVLNISVQQTFSESPYNFSVIIVGLLYVPTSLGYVVASVFGGRWNDYIMHRQARRAGLYDENGKFILRPEDRLGENAWIAAVMYPGALVWYGWTAEKGVHWIVPAIANFFFGMGSMTIFGASTTMLTEFMPKRSSSGVATNNFIRNIFSCIGGIVAAPLIDAIGDGWLFTGLGIICWISALSVVGAMKRYGPRWRKDMDEKMKAM